MARLHRTFKRWHLVAAEGDATACGVPLDDSQRENLWMGGVRDVSCGRCVVTVEMNKQIWKESYEREQQVRAV